MPPVGLLNASGERVFFDDDTSEMLPKVAPYLVLNDGQVRALSVLGGYTLPSSHRRVTRQASRIAAAAGLPLSRPDKE